jgi:hypothetical protein
LCFCTDSRVAPCGDRIELCFGAKALLTAKRGGPWRAPGEQSRYMLVLATASIVIHHS